MDDARKLDLRPLLTVGALVAVALTMWAAGAFAAGGSSWSDPAGREPAAYIQTQDDQAAPRDECPEHQRGGGGGGSGSGSDSSGSEAGNL